MSHASHVNGLMGCSLGSGMVHCFKSGKILKLLGEFGTQGLAPCSKLVDFCSLFGAKSVHGLGWKRGEQTGQLPSAAGDLL